MGWIRRVHQCVKPDDANTGDIWQCDECQEYWASALGFWFKVGTSGGWR